MSLQHFWDGEATRPAGGTVRASRARSGSTPAPSHPFYIVRTPADWERWLNTVTAESLAEGDQAQRWLRLKQIDLKSAPIDFQYLRIPRINSTPLTAAVDENVSAMDEMLAVDTIKFNGVGRGVGLRMTAAMYFGCSRVLDRSGCGTSLTANLNVKFRNRDLGWIRRTLKEGMGPRFSNRRFRRTPISALRRLVLRYRVLTCHFIVNAYVAFDPKDRVVYINNRVRTLLGFEYVAAKHAVEEMGQNCRTSQETP